MLRNPGKDAVSSLFISTALRRIVFPVVLAALAIGFAARVSRASDTSPHRPSRTANSRHSVATPHRRSKAHGPHTRKGPKRRSHQAGKPRTRKTTRPQAGRTKAGRTQGASPGGGVMTTQPTGTKPAATLGGSPQQTGGSETANSGTTAELFAPTSVWNQPLPPTAAIDPNSPRWCPTSLPRPPPSISRTSVLILKRRTPRPCTRSVRTSRCSRSS